MICLPGYFRPGELSCLRGIARVDSDAILNLNVCENMNADVVKVIGLVPGSVQALTVVDAGSLTEDVFWNEYVCKHIPVVIKNAAATWPAIAHWKMPGYLEGLCVDENVRMSLNFNPMPSEPLLRNGLSTRKLHACIEEIRRADEGKTFSLAPISVPEKWGQDLGGFPFMGKKYIRRPRGYPGKRLFVYKNASTEWHYHPIDETVTTQLLGSKRFSLFRLDDENWQDFSVPIKTNLHHMACRDSFFPRDKVLIKYEAVLDAGDAIYIPPFWWHGVDPADTQFGVTLAQCFRTPLRRLGAWNEPVTREFVRDASRMDMPILSRCILVFSTLLMISCSSIARKFSKEKW